MISQSKAAGLALAVALVSAPLFAAPTATFVRDIPVGGLEVTPTGIAVGGSNAYVVGFSQRRVLKIEGANTATPTVSVLARTDNADAGGTPIGGAGNATTWIASTGLITADFQAPNRLLVAGDQFTDGASYIINTDDGSLIAKQAAQMVLGSGSPSDRRVAGAVFNGTSSITALFQAGTNFWEINTNLSALSGSGFYTGAAPAGSNQRDLVFVPGTPNRIFVSYNNGTNTNIGILEIVDNGTAGSLTGDALNGTWYSTTSATGTGTVLGIGYFDGAEADYLLLADRRDETIEFINLATKNVDLTISDNLDTVHDAAIMKVGSETFLLATQVGGTAGSRVSVFQITEALTNVEGSNWTLMK